MRYARQAFEITVPLPAQPEPVAALRQRFLDLYRSLYGHADPTGAIEIVTLRTMAIGVTDKPTPQPLEAGTNPSAPVARRKVRLRGGVSEWPVFERAGLTSVDRFPGPAIIEEANATTVVLPNWTVIVDRWGNLRLIR
jgi:N-methylhydantoinase A